MTQKYRNNLALIQKIIPSLSRCFLVQQKNPSIESPLLFPQDQFPMWLVIQCLEQVWTVRTMPVSDIKCEHDQSWQTGRYQVQFWKGVDKIIGRAKPSRCDELTRKECKSYFPDLMSWDILLTYCNLNTNWYNIQLCKVFHNYIWGMKVVQWTVWYAAGGRALRHVNASTTVAARAMMYNNGRNVTVGRRMTFCTQSGISST